ncbi:MAG: 50S ribosomal protein L35 [Candidatus Paceibacterota bacterium]|jgi:large subunit ribosomal protein L35
MANKAKTRKSITKRFKITKTGKVLRRQTGQNHLLSKKSSQKKRNLRKLVEVSPNEIKKIKRILSY